MNEQNETNEVTPEVEAAPAEATIKTGISCPHCGENIIFEVPTATRRGELTGIALVDMTDDQIKIEIRNSKSVLSKAEKRGACPSTIIKNKARVDAVIALRDERNAAKAAAAPAVEENAEVAAATPTEEPVEA